MGAGAEPGHGFGGLLRRYRFAAGLTQEELAQRSGLSVRTLSDMERGRRARPFIRSVRLVADALELPGPARAQLMSALYDRAGEAALPALPAVVRSFGNSPRPGLVTRQLPAPLRHFAGRAAELRMLTGLLDQVAAGDSAATVLTIGGTAGVGKTTLAVHWSHQVTERFPDGQLFANLRGYDPSGSPVAPADAIGVFLAALGVPAGQIPADPQARAGLYRSVLAGRRMLIVLDNARDASQVRPLLPGSSDCLTVVTSRSQLTGLIATEGACPLVLDMLTQAESGELLAARLGAGRVAAEPQAVAELIELCSRLPLALAVVAARAELRPHRPLAELGARLRDRQGRLDGLDTGEPVSSVRAVFSWSYEYLAAPAARMFRLLGMHPGPDITGPAAASLADVQPRQALAMLGELTGASLLAEHVPGRFALHDLLRAYAAERAQSQDGGNQRAAAAHRMLDHYLHTAYAAERLLNPTRDLFTPAAPQPGVRPEDLASHGQALAWLEAEHRVLLAVIAWAASNGLDDHAWQLPCALVDFFARRGYWGDALATQRSALAAAQRLGDHAAQGLTLRYLGYACIQLGRDDEAQLHLRRAIGLYQERGDLAGEARTRINLARAFEQQSRYAGALDQAEQALRLAQAIGWQAGCAKALNAIGWCRAALGDYSEAVVHCEQAVALCHELGDRNGEASTWDSLGYARHHLGQHTAAASCYGRALEMFRELGDRYEEAVVLGRLGDTYDAAGSPQAAGRAWQHALAILDDLNHPRSGEFRRKLADLSTER